jgi:hypothetical protein
MEVFGNLSKRLRDIEDLPLKIVSVQPISPGNILVHFFIFCFIATALSMPLSRFMLIFHLLICCMIVQRLDELKGIFPELLSIY